MADKLSVHVYEYLDAHGHSEESLLRARAVLTKFDFLVSLATERALAALPLPEAAELDTGWIAPVIPLRRGQQDLTGGPDYSDPTPA